MGFNKKLLPQIEELIHYLEKHGNSEFESRWINRTDAWDGPHESIEFIVNYLKNKYINDKKVSNDLH